MKNHFQLMVLSNYELRSIYQYEMRNVRRLSMSDGGHLIAAVSNNFIRIYSTINFDLVCQLRGHVAKIQEIIWRKFDTLLISCASDGMIYTFNTFNGSIFQFEKYPLNYVENQFD